MENIIDFNKFRNYKKLNEVTDQRAGGYGGGGDTYFANVKGNFAGADQTLIGSAVIKLFRFVKRKGYQVLLYTWFKPNLYREYMSGLLRYIIRNEMNLPKAKTLYDAIYTHDVNKEKIAQPEKLKIKFVAVAVEGEKEKEKTYNVFKIGSEVKDDKDVAVKDGYYNLTEYNRVIKVVDGKLTETDASLSEDALEPEEEQESEPVSEDEKIDKDIAEFIKKIKAEYAKGSVKPEVASQSIKETDELIKFFKGSIDEMKELLTDNDIEGDEISRIKQDLDVYEANMKALEDLKSEITKKTTPVESEKEPAEKEGEEVKEPEKVNASFNYIDDVLSEEVDIAGAGGAVKNVARAAGQIKVGDQKVTKNKRIGDELNQLSQVDIDLNDPEFVKQFDSDDIKKACTTVVLEGKSEICKIQLGAERLYMKTDEKGSSVADAKLQNNWLKMVQTIKNQFSRFMLVDVVDPIALIKKLSGDEISKFQADATGPTNKPIKELDDALKASKNPKLNDAVSFDKSFRNMGEGNFGITAINSKKIVYCYTGQISVGASDAKCQTYRVVASVLSGMTDDTTSPDFKQFINKNVNSFPEEIRPKKSKRGGYEHIATFILTKSDHLSVSDQKNWVNVIFVYSDTGKIKQLDDTTSKHCVFYFKNLDKQKDDNQLKSEITNSTDQIRKDALVPISVSSPWLIKPAKDATFGLSGEDKTLNVKELPTKYSKLIQIRK